MFFLKYILNNPTPTPSHWFLVHQVLKKCFDTSKGGILDVDMTVINNYTSIWFMYLPLISLVFIWGNHHRWTERTHYKDTGFQWLRVWAQNLEWSGFIHGSMAYCLGKLPAEPQFPLWNRYNHSIHLQNCPTMKWNDAQKYSAQFLACSRHSKHVSGFHSWASGQSGLGLWLSLRGWDFLWTCLSHKPVSLVKTLCLFLGFPNCKVIWLLLVCIPFFKNFFQIIACL